MHGFWLVTAAYDAPPSHLLPSYPARSLRTLPSGQIYAPGTIGRILIEPAGSSDALLGSDGPQLIPAIVVPGDALDHDASTPPPSHIERPKTCSPLSLKDLGCDSQLRQPCAGRGNPADEARLSCRLGRSHGMLWALDNNWAETVAQRCVCRRHRHWADHERREPGALWQAWR